MKEQTIKVKHAQNLKPKPDGQQLEFGTIFTDHMFVMDYTEGKGWHDPQIVPYQNLSLDPAAIIFHYGQTVFEGLKAYMTEAGDVQLFRPKKNFARLNKSNERLRSEEHTSELQSRFDLVCRLLLEKKKKSKLYIL